MSARANEARLAGGEVHLPDHGPDPGEPAAAPPGWYGWLLGGLAPVLLVGFAVSAVANRLVFAGWALLVGGVYVAILHRGFTAGRPPWRAALEVLLPGLVLLALLAWVEREILRLGINAILPPLEGAP